MEYRSTRDPHAHAVSAATAIRQGLAPDGGLFVPTTFPEPSYDLASLTQADYQTIAQTVLGWFFPDLADLAGVARAAYGSQWASAAITPLVDLRGNTSILELFHGPTLAFKDVALQALPQLLTRAKQALGASEETVILTATSGDTGTAALRGFRGVAGTRVIVFYPNDGISPVQEAQMLGQAGDHQAVVAVEGNFDQAQTRVKEIFTDPQMAAALADHGQAFSSANSMNIGRLIPQVAYYFAAYGQAVARGTIKLGEALNFAVPTGNFGDILAGYYAKQLGLPVGRLICASNENHVLTDFFASGTYDKRRQFTVTNAPAMDILVSSNLERLLFAVTGEDAGQVASWMDQLATVGCYSVSPAVHAKLGESFAAGYANPDQVKDEIRQVFIEDGYLLDPHSAIGAFVARRYQEESGDERPTVLLATASPAKFPETVLAALTGQDPQTSGQAALAELSRRTGQSFACEQTALFGRQARAPRVVTPAEMEATVREILQA